MGEDSTGGRSVYGLRVFGLNRVVELPSLAAADEADLLPVRVSQSQGRPPALTGLSRRGGVRLLADGRVLALRRIDGTATYYGPPLASDELAHPYLGAAAVTFSRWAQREVFHAGAFAVDGRAWIVIGGRTAGKSTLMAAIAAAGLPVIADDLAVLAGTTVYAGPRSIDLREPVPPGALADPVPRMRPSRSGTRSRVFLPPITARWPLGGWFFLHWDTDESSLSVPMSVLLGRLAAVRSVPDLPSDPATILTLSSYPAWDLRRPRDWRSLPSTVDMLLRATQRVAARSAG